MPWINTKKVLPTQHSGAQQTLICLDTNAGLGLGCLSWLSTQTASLLQGQQIIWSASGHFWTK